jgi:hypothetical protein
MELPTTKLRISLENGSAVPFRVTWDGKPIPSFAHSSLHSAQIAGEAHLADLLIMGIEG